MNGIKLLKDYLDEFTEEEISREEVLKFIVDHLEHDDQKHTITWPQTEPIHINPSDPSAPYWWETNPIKWDVTTGDDPNKFGTITTS